MGAVAVVAIAAVGGVAAWATGIASNEAGDDAPRRTHAPSPSPVVATVTPSTEPTPSPEPKGRLLIHGTGDVSLDPSYIPAFRTNGYAWAWSGLGGLFRDDDLTVINLECPATDIVAPLDKTFVFRCDPDALPVARRWGVEVANLANNHAYDHGPRGLVDSIRNVRASGIEPVGAGRNRAESLRPAVVDVNGWRVAVVGLAEVIDPDRQVAGRDKPGTAAGHDFSLALKAIRDAAARADLVVVTIHWGVELDTQPRDYQVAEARMMIEAGADVIFGHHAHRPQPLATYRGRPIFYGLGNFVWPRLSTEGATTAVAEVLVRPNGTIRGRLLPAIIGSDGHPVLR
jgi:poly-gamma-glutamate synthesis protein (capsule biosynthesis protein)